MQLWNHKSATNFKLTSELWASILKNFVSIDKSCNEIKLLIINPMKSLGKFYFDKNQLFCMVNHLIDHLQNINHKQMSITNNESQTHHNLIISHHKIRNRRIGTVSSEHLFQNKINNRSTGPQKTRVHPTEYAHNLVVLCFVVVIWILMD